MSESILVALITACGSIIGTASLINWRLQALEKKVDSHNNYAKMFSETTTDIALMKQEIQFIKERIGG